MLYAGILGPHLEAMLDAATIMGTEAIVEVVLALPGPSMPYICLCPLFLFPFPPTPQQNTDRPSFLLELTSLFKLGRWIVGLTHTDRCTLPMKQTSRLSSER